MLDREVPLETGMAEPVVLRTLTTADAEAFARHVARDGARLREHLSWPAITDTPDGAARWLASYERRRGRAGRGGGRVGGRRAGRRGAAVPPRPGGRRTWRSGAGWSAAGEGHGVAAAACRAILGVARRGARARSGWSGTPRRPTRRSRALAERLGFRYEGTLRSAYPLNDTRLDLDVLSLVGEEIDEAVGTG